MLKAIITTIGLLLCGGIVNAETENVDLGKLRQQHPQILLTAERESTLKKSLVKTIKSRIKEIEYGIKAEMIPRMKILRKHGLGGSFEFPLGITMDEYHRLMKLMKSDGTFTDVNYASTQRSEWPVRTALVRMKQLIVGVKHLDLSTKERSDLKTAINNGINFWLEKNPKSDNWWYNEIGTPKLLGNIAIMLEDDLTAAQMQGILKIMSRSKIGRTGQNRVWLAGNVMLKALLSDDEAMLKKAAKNMLGRIEMTTKEGIQADYSFHQHGPQFYQGNYGRHFVYNSAYAVYLFRDTKLAPSSKQLKTLSKLMLDATQWMTWGELLDYNAWGRQITYATRKQGPDIMLSASYMADLPGKDKEVFENWKQRIAENGVGGKGSPVGNKMFWRSDFMVNRTKDYYTSVRMNSKRTIGGEITNNEGLKNYFMSDGCNYIYVDGDEYEKIFPVWDWNRVPGVTCALTKTFKTWTPYRGKTDFVGGASDGKVGIATMDYNHFDVSAKKSWFFLQNHYICLAAGIASDREEEIHTSINQCHADGKVEKGTTDKWDWVYHDKVGYLVKKGSSFYAETKSQSGNWKSIKAAESGKKITKSVFNIGIKHGEQPNNGSYCYIVAPGSSAKKVKEMALKEVCKVLKNTQNIQAICENGQFMAVFFRPGKYKLLDQSVEVSSPCVAIWDGKQLTVSDPTQKLSKLTITINGKAHKIQLPKGGNAGKSVNIKLR